MEEKIRPLFFIVGNSRSGTTLIARILKKHQNIHVLNETHFFEEFSTQRNEFSQLNESDIYRMINLMLTIQRKDYYRKSEYQEYPEKADQILADYKKGNDKSFTGLIQAFFENEARNNGKKRAGDQTPRHVFYANDIFSMFPGAKVIHMVRDPRAVLFSQKKKWKSGLRMKQPLFEVIRTFINYHPITMAVLWSKAVSAGLEAETGHGCKKVKTIIFERFVADPENQVKEICSFLDISFNSDMLDVDVELSATRDTEGQKGVSQKVAGQWQDRLSNTEAWICEKYTGSTMELLGYSIFGKKPNRLIFFAWLVWFPFHLGTAFLLNLGRMGNPVTYIRKRLFSSTP